MLDGGPQGDAAAQRVAHDVGLFDPQMLDQGGDVVSHQLEAQRAIDVGGAPMGLQIDGDHLPVLGEGWQHLAEHLDPPTPPCSRISGSPAP